MTEAEIFVTMAWDWQWREGPAEETYYTFGDGSRAFQDANGRRCVLPFDRKKEDMKTVTEETVVFVKTRYTCDDCGNPLLEGEKPVVCVICEKEMCDFCQELAAHPEEWAVLRICRRCYGFGSPFLIQWREQWQRYEQRIREIRAAWKTVSGHGREGKPTAS